jgi:adenylate cyclase
VLAAAGFDRDSVSVETITVDWRLSDPDGLFDAQLHAGVRTAAVLRAQPPDRLDAIRTAMADGVRDYADGDDFALPIVCNRRMTHAATFGAMADGEPERLDPTIEVAERLARLGERHLVWPDVCRRAGVEHELADRLWRALGFPDVPEDEPDYTEEDVRALRIAGEGFAELTDADRARAVELLVGEARVVSAHLTSIAETEVEAIAELSELGLRRRALSEALEHGLERSALGWLIFYALRRRLDEAVRRRAGAEIGQQPVLAVGFVDLVDFTRASAGLEGDAFAGLLDRFEVLAADVVTEAGGRIVKLIGDEAMLVCPTAAGAARAALEILAATGVRDLPPARAGLALGPLLARSGDYFGPAANLASRLIVGAQPGTVVVDRRLAEALRGDTAFALTALGRRRLKGVGEIEVFGVASVAPT